MQSDHVISFIEHDVKDAEFGNFNLRRCCLQITSQSFFESLISTAELMDLAWKMYSNEYKQAQ